MSGIGTRFGEEFPGAEVDELAGVGGIPKIKDKIIQIYGKESEGRKGGGRPPEILADKIEEKDFADFDWEDELPPMVYVEDPGKKCRIVDPVPLREKESLEINPLKGIHEADRCEIDHEHWAVVHN